MDEMHAPLPRGFHDSVYGALHAAADHGCSAGRL